MACALTLMLAMSACAAAQPSSQGTSPEPAGTPASSESPADGGEVVALEPGGLDAGTRYVIDELGVSLQPDEAGWFAVVPQGGDVAISREDVTVYVMAPDTVLGPGGAPVDAPPDPEAFLDAVDATPLVDVLSSEPFDSGGLTGVRADLEAAGGQTTTSPTLLTTGTGEYGLADGQFRWVVLDVDGRPIVVSVERAEPDIEASWELAGALVESLTSAP